MGAFFIRLLQRLGLRLLLVVVVLGGFAIYNYFNRAPDRVVQVADTDTAMNAAIADAKTSLPLFWRAFDQASRGPVDPNQFSVKIAMTTTGGGIENIWASDIHHRDGRLYAKLANDPEHLAAGLHLGSEVEVDPAKVIDWSMQSARGMYGHYTTRVLLAHMSAEEAGQVRAMLTAEPLPPDWRQ